MNRHWQILRTYVVRWQFWGGVFIWATQFLGFAVAASREKGYEMLPFSLGFTLLFVSGGIGSHVKEQLASYRARLIPDFRRPHLLWAGALLSAAILSFVFAAAATSLSVLFVFGLAVFVSSCAFVAMCRGGWRSLVLIVCFVSIFGIQAVNEKLLLLQGNHLWLPFVLLILGLIWLVRTFRFLATLDDETPDYQSHLRRSAGTFGGPRKRRENAAALKHLERSRSIWLRLADRSISAEATYIGDSRWRRMLHWQKAIPNWWVSVLMPCLVWVFVAAIHILPLGAETGSRRALTMTAWIAVIMPQMMFLNAWQARAGVLKQEFTFPVSRSNLIVEQGLTILFWQFLAWGLLMIQVLAAASILPVRLPTGWLPSLVLVSGVWQLVGTGLCACFASMRSTVPLIVTITVSAALGAAMTASCITTYTPTLLSSVTGGLLIVAASVLYLAYNRWLTMDIG